MGLTDRDLPLGLGQGSAIEVTADPNRYFASPASRRLEARRYWCASPGDNLFALVAWGRLEAEDAEQVIETLEACARTTSDRRLQLVVLAEVESVAAVAMTRFVRYYATRPAYLAGVEKEAVVRPEGVVAMLAEGFHRVVPLPFPARVFTRDDEALAWLRPELVEHSVWLATLRAAVRERGRVVGPELERLERMIRATGAGLSVTEAARRTGSSPRTLQRRLQAAGTSFAREKTRVLVAEAKRQLGDDARDIKAIAFELGFAAPQRFTELFTRETGQTPAAWRAALQGAERAARDLSP